MRDTTKYGFLARLCHSFIPMKKKHWVFSASHGQNYREGSKYLMEFMLKERPDYHCTFVTRSKAVKEELDKKGIPCVMNCSWKGIKTVAQADTVFYTQSRQDICFAFKRKGRKYYFLIHGMPLKRALGQLPSRFYYNISNQLNGKKSSKTKQDFFNWLITGYKLNDVEFVSACSDFLAQFLRKEYPKSVGIKVLGMPRNDALFQPLRMKGERWMNGLEGKFIITYMPTHRGYGTGVATPTPFINRPDIQKWMKENNVVLLMKNHPNMIPKLKDITENEVIHDITKMQFDPQVCIYHSDVLVTDFSSVWMDYLLLKRPLIFYIYDNFEDDDVGTYYDIREDPPGAFCYDEEAFFQTIRHIKADYDAYRPSERLIHKYHKYIDGDSCERYYREISKRYE